MDTAKDKKKSPKKKGSKAMGEKTGEQKSSSLMITEVPEKHNESKSEKLDDDSDFEEKQDSVQKDTPASPKKKSTAHGKKEKEALKEYNSFNRV